MKIKQTMYVRQWENDTPTLMSYKGDSNSSYTNLGSVEVEVDFDMPTGIEIRDMRVGVIDSQIEKVKADTEVTLERLLGERQKLMAIES